MRSDCFEIDDTKLILMIRLFLSEVDCFCVDTLTGVSATVGSMSHTVFCVLCAGSTSYTVLWRSVKVDLSSLNEVFSGRQPRQEIYKIRRFGD